MRHVKTTNMSIVRQIPIPEFGKVVGEGREFFCTENRFKWLSGHNKYNVVFVTEVKDTENTEKEK